MSRPSDLQHVLLIGALLFGLGGAAALAQPAAPADDTAAAAPADQPRRGRERRRATERAELSAPASTAAAAPAAPEAAAANVIDERRVCKNIKLTGTNISKRVCGTPEQWAATDKKTSDNAQETMRQVREATSIVVSQPSSAPSAGGN